VPLTIPAVEAAADNELLPKLAALRHRFTVEQTEALRNAARGQGVTLNDLLLRDMFLAAQDWLDRHDTQRNTGLVRIAVPINLRTRLHTEMPAANCVCMINIERRVHRWKDRRKMLDRLRWEMGMVKRLRVGVVMLRLVQLLRFVTGSLRLMLPDHRSVASCCVSNLGQPMCDSHLADHDGRIRTGNVELVEVELLPPVRPFTSASFGVASFGGRLTLSLHADRRLLGEEGGRELLELYANRLDETAREATSDRTSPEPSSAAT
jgi:NRPS condensation-like uncharacterized protein